VPVDVDEPRRVAEAAAELGLSYVVLTSVSRDDLDDGGASHYAETVKALRARCPGVRVEVLIPDYLALPLETVLAVEPEVVAHNLEVVRSLTPCLRDQRCSYDRSLTVLRQIKEVAPGQVTKSSLLLGLGEEPAEVEGALDDLRQCGVDILCLGQYLQPSARHYPVEEYIAPERFDALAELAKAKGFAQVVSGPLVRTSYHAAEVAEPFGDTPGLPPGD
jgi:lipoic acid synthetase